MYPVIILVLLSFILQTPTLSSEEGFCRKCEILRKYHKEHPSKYEYYDDYIKDLEAKGADNVNPNLDDLPEDIRYIMDPSKSVKE